jgi:hypothetical protein
MPLALPCKPAVAPETWWIGETDPFRKGER